MEKLEAAQEYALRKWAVFPVHGIVHGRCTCGKADCSNPGKHPAVNNGFHSATTNPIQIEFWWGKHPAWNIGIATGKVSGIFVVDLDISPTKDGFASLKALENVHGPVGATATVNTGGGGMHLYFEMPEIDLSSGVGSLGPGIDIRANGGYAVAPPSSHISGKFYTWSDLHD